MLSIADITPCMMIKNEDYWIAYALRDLLATFHQVIVLDTGSTDNTISIIKSMKHDSQLILIEDNYGNDAEKIGNGRNVLRAMCPTYWMFLVDGDEIWTKVQLRKLLEYSVVSSEIMVCMGTNLNMEDVNGVIKRRTHDSANKDILFNPDVKWKRLDYPFEGYGLGETLPMSKVQYLDVNAYHMRHTLRSSKNAEAYFRNDKYGYFPYKAEYEDVPADWLHPIMGYPNPYLKIG